MYNCDTRCGRCWGLLGGLWDSLEKVWGGVEVFQTILFEQLDSDRVPGRFRHLGLEDATTTGRSAIRAELLVQRSAPRFCAHGLSGRGCVLRLLDRHGIGRLGRWVPHCAHGEGRVDRGWIFRAQRILKGR